MELIEHRCKRCGGELKKIGEGRWSCPYCACVYDEAVVQKNTRSLHEEFDEVKREIVCNLRRNLYDAVNEEYISSEKVRECAAELKKYLPSDFAACFYEVAVSNNVKQLTKHIRRINVEENYSEIECVIRFLIKSLQTEYLLELNNLVERAYKQRDLVLFEKYSTEISVEAEKVEGGVYETKMPRDVFVAYSSKDMETVSELCEVLEGQGLKCFVAARNLRHGKGSVENYDKLLCEAMDHCKSFVFVSSTNSRSFSCDALTKELPYIQERDIENAPAEHKNNYANMPHSYKKPRVEYRIEESRGFSAPDAISNEFFDGYERVYSPEAVAERIAKQLLLAAEKKAVKKPTPAPAPAPVIVQSAPAEVGGQRIEPLLKRASIFIDDGEWEDAEAYCEKALDIDPECTQAYIYKLMIDVRVKKQEELADCKESFEENGNFKKAVRFADEETAKFLNGCITAIIERNETERKDKIYRLACSLMKENTVESYQAAISKFGEIPSWLDVKDKIDYCRREIKVIEDRIEAARVEAENKKKNDIYRSALKLLNLKDSNLRIRIQYINIAKNKFQNISGWKDADEKILECDRRLEEIKKQLEIEMAAAEKRRRKAVKISAICSGIVAIVIVFAIVLNTVIVPAIEENQSYNAAISLMDDGKYEEAIEAFEALDGYKDSADRIEECRTKIKDRAYNAALKLMEEGKYDEAIKAFEALGTYKESDKKVEECNTAILDKKYNEAVSLLNNKKYADALKAFKALGGYKDSSDKIVECETELKDIDYNAAVTLMNEGKYAEAIVAFVALGGHKDSATKIEECKTALKDIDYNAAVALMTEGKYAEAIVAFEAMDGYKDSATKIEECKTALKDIDYNAAVALMNEGKYAEAIVAFEAMDGYKDSAEKIEECGTAINEAAYNEALALIKDGNYANAILKFETMSDYRDSAELLKKCRHYTSYSFAINVTETGYTVTGYSGTEIDLEIPNVYMGLPINKIKSRAFSGCDNLISVTIPDSIVSVGESAFSDCSSLTGVYINDLAKWCAIDFDNGYANPLFYAKKLYLNNQPVTELVIPDGVTSIGSYVFRFCEEIEKVTIPDSVKSIGRTAFGDCCSLTSITVPDSVTSIGEYAFFGCSSLESITLPFVGTLKDGTGKKYFGSIFGATDYYYNGSNIPESLKKVIITDCKTIYGYAFYDCTSLTNIEIGDSVMSIGDNAFYGCDSLTSVEIGDSVTSIGYEAFYGCYSLKTVFYTGTSSQWLEISIGSNNSPLSSATKVYNYVPEGE